MAEPVQDADALRQAGVQLFPTILCASAGHQTAAQGLGGRWRTPEMDHQTGTA